MEAIAPERTAEGGLKLKGGGLHNALGEVPVLYEVVDATERSMGSSRALPPTKSKGDRRHTSFQFINYRLKRAVWIERQGMVGQSTLQ